VISSKEKISSLIFFFSDIEGSTRLVQQLGSAYVELLEKHRAVIRQAIVQYNGTEIGTAGDGFFITFANADNAIAAAIFIQQVFGKEEWAKNIGLKVRIGIHCGSAIPTTSGITGLEVHRASRICSVAHGGQVLMSKTVCDQFSGELAQGASIQNSGTYELKDFDQPEVLFQLMIPGVQTFFSGPRSVKSLPRLAVLPFSNRSGDPDQEYFCEGISEEIILALSRIHDLRVVARSASFSLKGEKLDARQAGKRLNATAILDGVVRKKGKQFRISAELVDTESGLNIWTGRFDSQLEDVFEVQDEIAKNIFKALKIKLFPSNTEDIHKRQTTLVDAFDFYLKGRRFYYNYSPNSVGKAIEMFNKAIEIDQSYSLAFCGLADCFSYLFMYEESTEKNLKNAIEMSQEAIAISPFLAEAYASRGLALSLKGQFEEAEASFEKSIELNPHLFEGWYQYARTCFIQGKLDKAARLFDEASKAQPEDFQSCFLAGQAFDDLGIKELAVKSRENGVLVAKNRLKLNPRDTRALYLGANGLVSLDKKAEGLDWLQKALTIDPEDSMLLYNAGCIFALMEMKERAFDCLERSIDAGLKQRGWFENDSNLNSIRKDSRFKLLLDRLI